MFHSFNSYQNNVNANLTCIYIRNSQNVLSILFQVTFRNIEQAIKSTGMQSEELLSMIASCPEGAETLVARIVHLLTERSGLCFCRKENDATLEKFSLFFDILFIWLLDINMYNFSSCIKIKYFQILRQRNW